MADFRRWFLALAVLALVLGSTVPANAQATGAQVQCQVNTAVQPVLRHEGLTELVGDIVLTCTPIGNATFAAPGALLPQTDISVSLSGTLSTSTAGTSGGLDALLLVDDPGPTVQKVCPTPTNGLLCPDYGTGGLPNEFSNGTNYNTFQGISGGPGTNSITFLGVPVDPPNTTALTYRITNIRIQGPSVPAGTFGLTPVYAFVNASPSTSVTITQATQPIVGFVSQGLNFSAATASPAPTFLQCLSYGTTEVGSVSFTENFQTAFKTQGTGAPVPPATTPTPIQTTPGQIYYTESGLQVAVPGGETGEATSATEFMVVISNIPSGVSIYVDTSDTDTVGGTATLISPAPTGTPMLLVDNTSGAPTTTTAVWEVTAANPFAIDSFTFRIFTSFTGAPGANGGSPQANVIAYAQGGFAPQVAAWTNGGAVPEFVTGLSPASPGQSLFQVSLCQTILLFPYVTDFTGFDTGIAISNTSLDDLPVGASHQTGACSISFYGNGALAPTIGNSGVYTTALDSSVANGVLVPGQTWAFSMSGIDSAYGNPGTTGYAIATCNFQYAHGYSFVSDIGIRNFAAAYLALVIPDAPRAPSPFLCASGFSCLGQAGEQLVH